MKYSAEILERALDWIKKLKEQPPAMPELNIDLDALDTSSVRVMVIIIRQLNDLREHTRNLINWFYEENDDMMDLGSYLETLAKVNFNLVVLPERD